MHDDGATPALRRVPGPAPRPPSPSLLTRRDVRETALQALLLSGAALLPARAWPALCRATSRVRRRKHRRTHAALFAACVPALLGPGADPAALLDAWREEQHRRRLALFRESLGRAASVEHRLVGAEHLAAALAAGRGAILWPAPFLHQALACKRTLAEAGFRGHQLSADGHGFLDSRFGRAVLNPLVLRTEQRFLAGRITFAPGRTQDAALPMRAVLQSGGLLIISNNAFVAREVLKVPLGGGLALPMATGPLRLARALGVPLLPCETLALAPFGPCETRIGADLFATPSADPIAAAAGAAAGRIREALARAPEQFAAWPMLRPA
jgi:hypothetical protein